MPSKVLKGLNCSFFLNLNNGTILCLSFKTMERNPNTGEMVSVLIERLSLVQISSEYKWEKVAFKFLNFKIMEEAIEGKLLKHDNIKIIEIVEKKVEGVSQFEIVLVKKTECFKGIFEPQNGPTDIIFKTMNINEDKYWSDCN